MRILHFAALIIDATEVDVRFAPTWLQGDHLLIDSNCLVESSRPTLAAHSVFEQLISRVRFHFANSHCNACMKGQNKLACEGLNGVLDRTWGNRGNFAPAGKKRKLSNRYIRFGVASLKRRDRAEEFARGDAAFGQSFYGTQRDKISEVVETLAPAHARNNQPKPVPVAQAARINAHNPARFALRKTFCHLACAPV